MLVEQLLSEKIDMAREKQEAMDELAANHRDAITNLCQRHSESMSQKDALLKEFDELVQGFQDMFRELLNERVTLRMPNERQTNSQNEPHTHILDTWSKSYSMTV